MHFAVQFGHAGGHVPVEPDMLALLAATAAWPLEALLVGCARGEGRVHAA